MVTRGQRRKRLRDEVFYLARGRCEWVACQQPATEMGHLHSIGMGGRKSADTLDNVAAFCAPHARASDGLYPNRTWYVQQLALLGVEPPYKAYTIAEALKTVIAKQRAVT